MGPEADKTILQRISAGDHSAVSECIETYGRLIWSLARRFLASPEDAEELVQDIYLELWSKAERFDPDKAGETTFVAMLARRRIIDRLRSEGRKPVMVEMSESHMPALACTGGTAEATVDLATAERALQALPPEHQAIIYQSVCEGYSHGEIAAQRDMPLGTVKTIIRRGLIDIRASLER